MDIPIGAEVICSDGDCGRSTYIVLNPVTDRVTHFVVEESNFPNIERLVPMDEIQKSDPKTIYLRCTRSKLSKMDPFIETDFIPTDMDEYAVPFEYPYTAPLMVWPFIGLPNEIATLRLEQIPLSELAVHRGANVHATDGHVGKVDEFMMDPENHHITHLVLRTGHLWGEKDITIPVSEIDRIEEDDVFLKIDRSKISALPAVPVMRRWR